MLIKTLITRAKSVYQKEGTLPLIKKAVRYLVSFLYIKYEMYVFTRSLVWQDAVNFKPKIDHLTSRIISTKQQLQQLINAGFDLGSLEVYFANKRLAKGCILNLLLIDRKVVWRGWIISTKVAQSAIKPCPYKVNFPDEACLEDDSTELEYRNRGIAMYGRLLSRLFILDKGIKVIKSSILKNNKTSISVLQKEGLGYLTLNMGTYIKILGLGFWKEKPVDKM